jgi:hypothetical protein
MLLRGDVGEYTQASNTCRKDEPGESPGSAFHGEADSFYCEGETRKTARFPELCLAGLRHLRLQDP